MYLSRRYILIKLLVIILFWGVAFCQRKRKAQDDVRMSPEILRARLYYKVRLNDTVCLPCAFKREYEGEFRILSYWEKSNSPVLSWPRYTLKKDCLEIKNIRSVDHGEYKCIAQNMLGKTEALRILTVEDRVPGKLPEPFTTSKPSMTKFPIPNIFFGSIRVTTPLVRNYVAIGNRIKLRCRIDGSPTPKIYWVREGKVMEKDEKYSFRPKKKLLVIKNFTKQEVGRYTCVGNNSDGVRNMSFLVDAKEDMYTKSPPTTTDPPKEVSEIRVRPGQNITLTCQAPVKKLTYLLWSHMSVSKKRRARQHEVTRDFTTNKSKMFLQFKTIKNGTRIQGYTLVNVSKAVHEGEYHCIGLFRKKSVLTVKVVKLIVTDEKKVLPIRDGSNSDSFNGPEEFPLNIVLPAAGVAFFLLVIFLCVCFVCSRKARHTKGLLLTVPMSPTQPQQQHSVTEPQEEDDEASMQILPVCNYDSLRKHTLKSTEQRAESLKSNSVKCYVVPSCDGYTKRYKSNSAGINTTSLHAASETNLSRNQKKTPCRRKYSDTTIYSCKNNSTINSNTLEPFREKKSCKNSPNRTDHKTSLDEGCNRINVRKSSCDSSKLWPGERLNLDDPEYMEYINENDRLVMKEYPTIERTKKYKVANIQKKERQNTNNSNSNHRPCSRESSKFGNTSHNGSISCCTSHNDSSSCGNKPLSIDSEEEEDQLLQREIKNWEPLLRHSTSVSAPDAGLKDASSIRAL